MVTKVVKVKYPRIVVSVKTHLRLQRIAKIKKVDMAILGEQIVLAGIKALEL